MTSRFTAGAVRRGAKKAEPNKNREKRRETDKRTAVRRKDIMQKREASCPCPSLFLLKNRPAAALSLKGHNYRKTMRFRKGNRICPFRLYLLRYYASSVGFAAKSQASSLTRTAIPARFLRRKISKGNFLSKTRRA